ncbi:transforming growth factor beta regulator 1-like isoform X2 [Watersipora subatra]|uniref:transforming growth factor beta regulator 1-like isoform X2 n=1 Tax=Watersipora subatra TaxID=2589382 RepID=UPI00355C5C6E
MDQKATVMTETSELPNFKHKYKLLKRKLKGLVYEHELLSDQLERTQKKLLRVSKDRSFLLDRMLRYEKVADTSSDSEATDQSESDTERPVSKKKANTPPHSTTLSTLNNEDGSDPTKKTPKCKSNKKPKSGSSKRVPSMSQEDLEKHLNSRPEKPAIEKATSSLPTEIFGNTERPWE